MASTATRSPAARSAPISRPVSVDLPRARRTGDPDRVGVAAERVGAPADLARPLAAPLDERQQPGERRPLAGARRGQQRLGIGTRG